MVRRLQVSLSFHITHVTFTYIAFAMDVKHNFRRLEASSLLYYSLNNFTFIILRYFCSNCRSIFSERLGNRRNPPYFEKRPKMY